MSPQDLFRLLRRFWLLIVALVLVGIASGVVASALVTPVYSSTSRVFVSVSSQSASVDDLSQGNSFAAKAVQSYAEVATSPTVLDPVIEDLGLNTTADDLASRVDVSTSTTSVVMGITATDPSPTAAASIANAVSSELASAVATLTKGSKGSASVNIQQIAPARPSLSPSSPKIVVNGLVGALVGLLVALLVIGLRRLALNKVESVDEIATVTEIPVVGSISRDRSVSQTPLRVAVDPLSGYSESIRDLRANLQYLTTAKGAQSIVITSSTASEGKTTTAANLALALAGAQTAVLVDADLRKPRVAELFGIDGSVGLTDVLVGRADLDDALQAVGDSGLVVLPAGGHPPNASELLQSEAMHSLIAELAERYTTVLFDTPPAGLLSDARVLARQCPGALMVSGVRRVRRPQLRSTLESLERAGVKTLGIVATFVPGTAAAYYELEEAEGRRGSSPKNKRANKRATAPRNAALDSGSTS